MIRWWEYYVVIVEQTVSLPANWCTIVDAEEHLGEIRVSLDGCQVMGII